MTREEAIDIIKAERECVSRQGRTGECCRDDMGCGACDLAQKDVDIIEAYDMSIEALKERQRGECRTCKHFVKGGLDGKTYVCEHPCIELDDYYDYACIAMEESDFCSQYEKRGGDS